MVCASILTAQHWASPLPTQVCANLPAAIQTALQLARHPAHNVSSAKNTPRQTFCTGTTANGTMPLTTRFFQNSKTLIWIATSIALTNAVSAAQQSTGSISLFMSTPASNPNERHQRRSFLTRDPLKGNIDVPI
jgi:hypothetical protein